jgi:hypothetical protein
MGENAPIQPQIPRFLEEVDLPQAHKNDSPNVLRQKEAIMLEAYANAHSNSSIQREPETWLDVEKKTRTR